MERVLARRSEVRDGNTFNLVVANKTRGNTMTIKKGNYVEVDYTGKLKDGTIFDSSIKEIAKKSKYYDKNRDYKPLGFIVGEGKLIPGFENGVKGMVLGEKKKIEIPPEDAYGKTGKHPLAGKTLIFEIEVKKIG